MVCPKCYESEEKHNYEALLYFMTKSYNIGIDS